VRIVVLRAATAACVVSDCFLTGRRVVADGCLTAASRSGVSVAAVADPAFADLDFVDFDLIWSDLPPDFAVPDFIDFAVLDFFDDETGLSRFAVAGFGRDATLAAARCRAGPADRVMAM
jgi:hypothetical protein